jgi:ABC-type nickel/cobalt efflux system permease component RcnA
MRELREKIRAAERERREREQQEAEARESRKAAAEREASVTRLSFDLDQFLYHVKKIEDDAFRFDYGGAVELLKRVRDVKESVPVLLAYLSGAAVQQFSNLNAEITEIATATARFVKDWQVRTAHTHSHTHATAHTRDRTHATAHAWLMMVWGGMARREVRPRRRTCGRRATL